MFGSEILEVAIGIIFIFILVSIICSAIREVIEGWLKTRSAYLAYGIRELLHDRNGTGLAKALYDHPQIHGLFQGNYQSPGSEDLQDDQTNPAPAKPPSILAQGGNLPSYIPAKNFAVALMDITVRGPVTNNVSSDPGSSVISLDTLRTNIFNLQNHFVQRALLAAIDSAQGNLDQVQANLQDWYDSAMDRVSGWYKRSTQWILFWIGIFVAVSLNINTLTIASFLFRNDTARANLVALAEARAGQLRTVADSGTAEAASQIASKELASLQLPIGWSDGRRVGAPALAEDGKGGSKLFWTIVWYDWIIAIPGWLLTALAVTMGAPFWFDILNKVMVIRSTVKPHEKSPEESSEDRQRGVKQPTGVGPQGGGAGAGGAGGAGGTGAASDPLASPPDEESDIDACGVDLDDLTPDEMLPEAKGGVA